MVNESGGLSEFPPPREFDISPYRRDAYVHGSPRCKTGQRKYAQKTPAMAKTSRSANRHLDNIKAIGLLATAAGAVIFLALVLAIANGITPAFKYLGNSIDSITGGTDALQDTSTPRAEWRKGSMPYLYQKDPQWAQISYADGMIADYGCGPTCLSMVYIYITGKADMPPNTMGQFSEKNGFVDQGMTSWRLMGDGAKALGINSYEIGTDSTRIRSLLESGHPIICSMRPGDFTTVGHFIVLCGINNDGTVEIRDPNSPDKSHKGWELSHITDQCSNLWTFG